MFVGSKVSTLWVHINLQEFKTQIVSRFINCLREQIKNELSFHTTWNLSDVINLALKVKPRHSKQQHWTVSFKKTYSNSTQPKKPVCSTIPHYHFLLLRTKNSRNKHYTLTSAPNNLHNKEPLSHT